MIFYSSTLLYSIIDILRNLFFTSFLCLYVWVVISSCLILPPRHSFYWYVYYISHFTHHFFFALLIYNRKFLSGTFRFRVNYSLLPVTWWREPITNSSRNYSCVFYLFYGEKKKIPFYIIKEFIRIIPFPVWLHSYSSFFVCPGANFININLCGCEISVSINIKYYF